MDSVDVASGAVVAAGVVDDVTAGVESVVVNIAINVIVTDDVNVAGYVFATVIDDDSVIVVNVVVTSIAAVVVGSNVAINKVVAVDVVIVDVVIYGITIDDNRIIVTVVGSYHDVGTNIDFYVIRML